MSPLMDPAAGTIENPARVLEQLIERHAGLWRGSQASRAASAGVPTGFADLDARLSPWHGWPRGGLSEILVERVSDAFGLTLPMLAALSAQPRWLLLVDPPHIPYAPALAASGLNLTRLLVCEAGEQAAWAVEQGLRSRACAAVLAWGADWPASVLRRLQLAAAHGDATALLFRGTHTADRPSPAVLRLQVQVATDGPVVTLLKQRGARAGAVIRLTARAPGSPPAHQAQAL